jgi:hypothetical protein
VVLLGVALLGVTMLGAINVDSVIAVLPIVLIVVGCTALAILFSRDR